MSFDPYTFSDDIYAHLSDKELRDIDKLLEDQMYEASEKSLYSFFINFWPTFDPNPLINNWHLECLCEHAQAAADRQIRRLVVNISPRCLPGIVNINMGDGSYKQLRNIKIGDKVLSSDRKKINTNKVLNVFDAGHKECVRLTFSDGHSLETSKEHKIYTINRGWVSSRDLLLGDIVISPKSYVNKEPLVDIPLDDAFLLGVWVAEGFKANKSAFAFANDTPEIINKAIEIAESKGWRYRYDKAYTHRFVNKEGELRGTGIKGSIRKWFDSYFPPEEVAKNCYDIRVPSCLFRASREAKIEFLNAYIACDGWIDIHSGKIASLSASEQLSKDIYRLFKQLGYSPTLKRSHREFNYAPQGRINCSPHYHCTISKNSELQQAKLDFNFYHKHIKLLSIPAKNTSKLNDVPSCLIPLDKVDCKYRYRVKKTKWLQSSTLKQHCLDNEWFDSLKLNTFKYLEITSIEDIGLQECFDIEVENDHTFFAEDILTHNSSKSTVNSIALPAYHLLRQPDEQFWLISHSERLFTQNIVYTRRIFDHPKYKNRWLDPNSPNYRYSITSDQNTKTRIDNNMGGRLMGGSPGTSALGMGYTIAVLDDILDSEESQNIQQVTKVNDWYSRTFLNRSNDNNNDVVIIVMQRLHTMDLTGYVDTMYKDQGWFILNIPARYESKKTFISPIGFNDKRTKERELMDPIRLSDEFLAQQEKNPIIYQTRYQQNPDNTEDNQFFQESYWKTTPFRNISNAQRVIVWDLSFTDNPKSSYTVGLVMELYNGNYYVVDMFREQCDTSQQIDAIKKMAKKYPYAITAIEIKANGHAVVNLIEHIVPNIYRLDPKLYGGSKEQRFGAVIPFCKDGKVWFYKPNIIDTKLDPTYDTEIIKKELLGFPLYTTNDIVDTFAYGILVLNQFNSEQTLMVGSEKMQMADEDFQSSKLSNIYESNNPLGYYVDNLASREDIGNLQW